MGFFDLLSNYVNLLNRAGVAELVDAQDLKSCVLRGVRVRFPPSAPLLDRRRSAISKSNTILWRVDCTVDSVMNLKSSIFAATLFAAVLIFVVPSNAQNRLVLAEAQRITGDTFGFTTRTPKGANIYSVSRPGTAMLTAIDKGFTDLFAIARKNGYRRRLNYSDYSIFVAKADRTKSKDGNYSPDIAVGAAQYSGTDYDQGGYIYAAGMVIAYNPCAFVIAEHTSEMNRVSDVVRYEGEHLVLFHNDRRRYNETADHSKGGGHPILK